MSIRKQSIGKLCSLLFALSLLTGLALVGCSDKDTNYYCNCGGNCNCGDGHCCDGDRHNGNARKSVYYRISAETLAEAEAAGATHVGGVAYDNDGNDDCCFSVAQPEIAKMVKDAQGNYLAELNVSGSAKHVDLFFYYEDSEGVKRTAACKSVAVDFSSELGDRAVIQDSAASEAEPAE